MMSDWYACTAGLMVSAAGAGGAAGGGGGGGGAEAEEGPVRWPATFSCVADVGDLRDVVGAGEYWDVATSSSREVTAVDELDQGHFSSRLTLQSLPEESACCTFQLV